MFRASVQKKGSSFKPTTKPKARPRPVAVAAPAEVIKEKTPESVVEDIPVPIVEEEEIPEPVIEEIGPPPAKNPHSIQPVGHLFTHPTVEGEGDGDANDLPQLKLTDIISSKYTQGVLSATEIQRRETRKEGIRERRKRASRIGVVEEEAEAVVEEEVESDVPNTPGLFSLFLT
jgi:hypothetical protein